MALQLKHPLVVQPKPLLAIQIKQARQQADFVNNGGLTLSPLLTPT